MGAKIHAVHGPRSLGSQQSTEYDSTTATVRTGYVQINELTLRTGPYTMIDPQHDSMSLCVWWGTVSTVFLK